MLVLCRNHNWCAAIHRVVRRVRVNVISLQQQSYHAVVLEVCEEYMWRAAEHKTPTGLTGNRCEEGLQIRWPRARLSTQSSETRGSLRRKRRGMRLWSQ